MMIKFGTDGWRAVISDEFTFANVRQVAAAVAAYLINHKLDKKPLIVGYDPRFLADRFAEEVVKVMEAAGISCLLTVRDTPTPVVAWEVKDRGACGAIMLTASHNPPQYCGIKFIPDYAGPANEQITSEIEKNLLTPSSFLGHPSPSKMERGRAERRGEVERFEPRERYLEYIKSFVDPSTLKRAKLKVVVDPMYGAGRGYLDKLLEEVGCQIEEIHNYRDVLFGGHNPEPDEANLKELSARVKEDKADLGLALDGDADRFGVVDEAGDCYSPNQVIAMLFDYLVEDKGMRGSVVRSLGTTHMLDAIAKPHNIKVHETPVGFKHIAQIMLKEPVIIGGEESGGLTIAGHIPEKDGILADLLVAEMTAHRKKPLSKIWEDLTKKIGKFEGRRGKVEIPEDKKQSLMEGLKKNPPTEVGGMKVVEARTFDGVKLIFKDGSWLLIRPSGTEPLVRIYSESRDPNVLDKIELYLESLL
ncbi:phosphoglucomutase/phosphomannomutase family protein [Candidatus Saganbacteria bacterium]|nr:phosphoglucomutase/phosphomannomutase family protein [Candidatus Saganbacteria bacterium]